MALRWIDQGTHVRLELTDTERLNPIGDLFWDDFEQAVAALQAAPHVQLVTLTGRGRAFSAGGDVRRMRDLADAARGPRLDPDALTFERARLVRSHRVLRDWVGLPALRIAALNGVAIGAGLSLALSCDVRIMSSQAWLDTGFANLGLPGDCGITHYLPRLLGPHRAARWLQEPRRVHADEALQLGLVDELAEPDALEASVEALRERVGGRSFDASLWVRRPAEQADALADALDRELEATMACKATEYYARSVASFASRREPAGSAGVRRSDQEAACASE